MDGTSKHYIATTGIDSPNSLTIDFSCKVYQTKFLFSCILKNKILLLMNCSGCHFFLWLATETEIKCRLVDCQCCEMYNDRLCEAQTLTVLWFPLLLTLYGHNQSFTQAPPILSSIKTILPLCHNMFKDIKLFLLWNFTRINIGTAQGHIPLCSLSFR